MALMTYLLRDRHGTYYFRRVIPPELRPFMPAPWLGKANWKRSLKTKLPADAKVRASRMLAECTADFQAGERRRRGEPVSTRDAVILDASMLTEIETDTFRELLARDAEERSEGDDRRHLQTPQEREAWPDLVPVSFGRKGMAEDHHVAYGDGVELLSADYRKALSRSDPAIVASELRATLRRRGLTAPLTPAEEHEAGLAVLRGHVRAYAAMLDRQRGEIVETPKPDAERGPRLSEAFAAWKEGGSAKGTKRPGDNTVREAQHAVRRFREWHGDIRLADITREKAREFRDALARVPTRLKRHLLKLPLRELLAHSEAIGPPAFAGTINKSLQLLSAIVTHAIRDGRMDRVAAFSNPFDKGMKLSVDAREVESREVFEAGDLRAIFGTRVFTERERPKGGGEEAAFWLPLIGHLTGARQGEIAQLRIGDVRRDPETGIWFFDISTEGGRSIKTASSRRRVPLHPVLEVAGLLRYRQWLLDAGSSLDGPLWPGIVSDAQGRRAGPWSKWFNRWLRNSAGVKDAGKVFHSFRHTFKRMARDAGLAEEMHDALTGHSGGGVGRSYGGGFGLSALAVAVAQLTPCDVVLGLNWEPGEKLPSHKRLLPRSVSSRGS